MKTTILNRAFEHPTDGWYHIEALGEHPNDEANVVQVIDGESCAAIVNRFNADAEAGRLSHGHEMLIDHEHFKHDVDKETRAYGWLQKLQNRDDGIYGQIRWTRTGKDAVDGGDYRFFSTEYDPKDLKILNNGKLKRIRPLRLDGLTLTNANNNKGQRPITNREQPGIADIIKDNPEAEKIILEFAKNRFRQPVSAGAADKNQNQRNKMKTVLTELDMSADASEESALGAVRKLKNRLTTAEEKAGKVTEMETQIATLLDEQMDGLLAEYKVTDTKVINRLKPVLKPLKNRADRISCLADFGYSAEESAEEETEERKDKTVKKNRVLNRGTGDGERPQPTGEEQAENKKATKIMNRARTLMKDTPNLSLATAVKMAQDEEATA
jgi:hypothetical protein